ncbi:MAG: antitoxin MazE-like protein [Terriglobales bacterium]|jgi:hypothetical protein
MQRRDDTINLRIDPALKAAFVAATEGEKRPVAEIIRELMRSYVEKTNRRKFAAEARRQSQLVADSPEESEVMHWIHHVSDIEGWK